MTPHKFTIQGSIGILSGTGKDTISVDLEKIVPENARQVAIVGDNGSGKSTILTLGLNPWREPGGLHGSVYDQFGEAGKREIAWSHAGAMYRSILEYSNGRTKRQKATLLFEDIDGSWRPACLPDNTVSDGKASTYDACLRHILGPQELYYICASRTQGAPKIAEHDDAKGLLRSLLDLDHVDALQGRAKNIRREVTKRRDELRDSVHEACDIKQQIDFIATEIAGIASSLPGMADAVTAADHDVALAKAEYAAVVENDYERIDLSRRRQEAQQRIDDLNATYREKWLSAKNRLNAAEKDETDAQSDMECALAIIDGDIAGARRDIASHEAVLTKRDAIIQAEEDLVTLEADIASREADLGAMSAALSELLKIEHSIAMLDSDITREQTKITALESALEDLKRRAAFVSEVPCHGAGKYATCPALADAMAAGTEIAAKERTRDEHKASIARIRLCVSEKDKEREAYDGATTEAWDALSSAIGSMRVALSKARETAALKHKVEAADSAIAAAEQRIVELSDRRDKAERAGANSVTAAVRAIAELREDLNNIESEGKARVEIAQKALDALPEPGADDAVDKAKIALAASEKTAQDARDAVSQAGARRAALTEKIASLKGAQEQADKLSEHISRLDDEVSHWDLLAKGLQGVVDLSIEAAGPSVAAIANDMLARTFGGRFSLRVVTQREQANGRTVETFDISVLDNETDTESSILHKSGGESVWLDAALSLAVALYQQDVAGRRYETRFADEADDGLAADRKRMYYQMSRAAMDIGGYDREYFVSHHPDASLWADAVINMEAL